MLMKDELHVKILKRILEQRRKFRKAKKHFTSSQDKRKAHPSTVGCACLEF